MKNVMIAGVFFLGSTLMVSCSDDQGHSSEQSAQGDHADHADHGSEPVGGAMEGMSLNDGKKWAMDEHTRNAFSVMALAYANHDHGSMDSASLKEVGSNLQQEIVGLIQGCTMDGDAHNQLHTFLTGYMAAVDALALNGQAEDAEKVGHYLEGYSAFFE